MSFAEYSTYDGVGLAELVANGEISPLELVDAAIENIEKYNGDLNAIVYKAYDEAREAAVSGLSDGPFKGVPFLIKDLSNPVKGWSSSGGSYFADERPAQKDSVMVARYRDAGLNFLGTTNTPELGIPGITDSDRLGLCRNPWNLDYHAGGSSGGAAAAVASGMVPMAHATDGGGSIRIPASCCGLVGLKPTRDRHPTDPEALWQVRGLIAGHMVCRSVRDSAAMLDITGYPEKSGPYAAPYKDGLYRDEITKSPGRLRVAWSSETAFGYPVDGEVQNALEKTAELLSGLDHEVREEGLGVDYRSIYDPLRIMAAANFAGEIKGISERIGREPEAGEFGPLAQYLYDTGCEMSAADGFLAFQKMRIASWSILKRFENFDVYLTPVMGTLPPVTKDYDLLNQDLQTFNIKTRATFPFTAHFNVTGQPSISLPLWQSENGLPIGMQFTARIGDEAVLFRLAAQLEKELPWWERRPPLCS